jgi:DNA-binding beta-propeller fold protein YncE
MTRSFALALALLAFSHRPAQAQQKGGEEETGPYQVVANWPRPLPNHDGWTWGSTSGIFAETKDRVFVVQRGELGIPEGVTPGPGAIFGAPGRQATTGKPRFEHCVLVLDADGKLIESWTQWDALFSGARGPHRVKISPYDPERHVWIVDDGLHQVFKFTHDGKKLVMALGEKGVAGNDDKHFGRPTDVAWLPDGTFFVSDGYTNTRVVKFDKDGRFLATWGKPGKGPSEFNTVHAIAVDKKRRVYVADRGNSRIQVFDENGKYLDEWPDIRQPYDILMTDDQHLWVSDGVTNKILKYDLTGKLLSAWGTYGQSPGQLWGGHSISVDATGNLYVAEVFNGRAQKFAPRPGADPARLVGRGAPLSGPDPR